MAEGSHTVWDGYPRTCSGCGQKLRITRDTIWRNADQHGTLTSWHFPCRLAQSKNPAKEPA